MGQKGLLSWHWSVNSASNEGLRHSQLEAYLPHPGFSGETLTKHHSRICLSLAIVNSKVVLKELLGPANLPGAQALRIHETTEVIMVRKDKNLMFTTFQVVAPSLECPNNGLKLAVVGLVSSLCRNHFPRKERY